MVRIMCFLGLFALTIARPSHGFAQVTLSERDEASARKIFALVQKGSEVTIAGRPLRKRYLLKTQYDGQKDKSPCDGPLEISYGRREIIVDRFIYDDEKTSVLTVEGYCQFYVEVEDRMLMMQAKVKVEYDNTFLRVELVDYAPTIWIPTKSGEIEAFSPSTTLVMFSITHAIEIALEQLAMSEEKRGPRLLPVPPKYK